MAYTGPLNEGADRGVSVTAWAGVASVTTGTATVTAQAAPTAVRTRTALRIEWTYLSIP
jgi:hypothetical protein